VQFFVVVGILIFLLLRSACKVSEPYDIPFWVKSYPSRRLEERRDKKQSMDT
jgi:hypothetical protein